MQKQVFFSNSSSASISGLIGGYVQSAYPTFGSPLIGRTYQAKSLNGYRYSFNGKEKDDETYGDGNWQDYGARMYNPRLGRFPTPDPLIVQEQEYAELSSYQFASLNPIKYIDLDGLEGADVKYESTHSIHFVGGEGMSAENKETYSTAVDNIVIPASIAVAGYWLNVLTMPLMPAPKQTTTKQAPVKPKATKNVVKQQGKPAVKTQKAEQLKKNAQQGNKFEKKTEENLKKTQENVTPQITVKTASGTKTKIDFIGKDKTTGQDVLTEAKSSSTAPLTNNQKVAFPEIEKSGAVVVGQGKPPYTGGTEILPSLVKILRPNNN